MQAQRPHHIPSLDRISLLAGVILLGYLLGQYVRQPGIEIEWQLPGLYIRFEFDVQLLVSALVGVLTAVGADWLLREHPSFTGRNNLPGLLLPALTATVLGVLLNSLPPSPAWWAVFGLGGVLLMLVLLAEYIAIDPDDAYYPLAVAGLAGLAFALFLLLAITVKANDLRLLFRLPLLTGAAGLVSLRVLYLRLGGAWALMETLVVTIVNAQITGALHYLPLSPAAYGLAALLPLYALTTLTSNLADGMPLRRAAIEPVILSAVILIITIGAA